MIGPCAVDVGPAGGRTWGSRPTRSATGSVCRYCSSSVDGRAARDPQYAGRRKRSDALAARLPCISTTPNRAGCACHGEMRAPHQHRFAMIDQRDADRKIAIPAAGIPWSRQRPMSQNRTQLSISLGISDSGYDLNAVPVGKRCMMTACSTRSARSGAWSPWSPRHSGCRNFHHAPAAARAT